MEQLHTKMIRRNDELGDCFPNDRTELAICVGLMLFFLFVGSCLGWLMQQ